MLAIMIMAAGATKRDARKAALVIGSMFPLLRIRCILRAKIMKVKRMMYKG